MNFIKKNKLVFLAILLVIIKLYLVSDLKPYIELNYTYDDSLYFNTTKSLISGNWLGTYNELTLVKGIAFPLFIMPLALLKIPYLLSLDILYIFAIITLCKVLKKHIGTKMTFILFSLLLFCPISFASLTYLKFYRNGFNTSIIILFFAALINSLEFHKAKRKIIPLLLLTMATIIAFNTREDFMWLIPSIVISVIYNLKKLQNKKTIAYFVIIPISIIAVSNIISFINYKNYKIYTTNELTNGAYAKFYKTLMSIDTESKIPQTTLSRNDLKKIADASKTFGLIEEKIPHSDVIDGTLVWLVRTKAMEVNKFKNGMEQEDFFNKITSELNTAFNEGILKKRAIPTISPLISPINKIIIKELPFATIKTMYTLISYNDIDVDYMKSFGNHEQIIEFGKMVSDNGNKQSLIKLVILKVIILLYQILIPFLFLLTIIKSIINKKKSIISKILIISILLNIIGIAYTHVAAFNAITYYYLAPLYSLILVYIAINIKKNNSI